jgi:hypothetical protein
VSARVLITGPRGGIGTAATAALRDARGRVGLEGAVFAEPVHAAVATLVRAALGPPARHLATTRRDSPLAAPLGERLRES